MVDIKKEVEQDLPVVLANYAKRFLEKVYDEMVFETGFGRKLGGLSSTQKYGIEFALNALTAFFERRIAEDTGFKKFIKEVGIDVAPEISKRLVNGVRNSIEISAKLPQEEQSAKVLLELEDKDLVRLLQLLQKEKEKKEVRSWLREEVKSATQGVKDLRRKIRERRRR